MVEKMKVVPVVFTFDDNMSFPAAVCISSLMQAAARNTFYDIFVLHSGAAPEITGLDKLKQAYPNMSIQYRSVGETFETAYEIRGITKAAYYRLLAADLIPEYDRVIYADVDTIFRQDLSELYESDLEGNYLGAVYALGINTSAEGHSHLKSIGLEPGGYVVSGFLLMDLNKMRKDGITESFKALANRNYKYQDQDIINLVCKDKIKPLSYIHHMDVKAFEAISLQTELLNTHFMFNPTGQDPLLHSNIHYNGVKPWKDWCPNIDQWWEYYRKSPIYDPQYYFTFFNNKLNHLDQLSLLKRLKLVVRYFIYGKR